MELPGSQARLPGPIPGVAERPELEAVGVDRGHAFVELMELRDHVVPPLRSRDLRALAAHLEQARQDGGPLLDRIVPLEAEVGVAIPDRAPHPLGEVEYAVVLVHAAGDQVVDVVTRERGHRERHVHVIPFPGDLLVAGSLELHREVGAGRGRRHRCSCDRIAPPRPGAPKRLPSLAIR